MVVDEARWNWWDDRSLNDGGRGVGIYVRDSLSAVFRRSLHLEMLLKTPCTVIGFNVSNLIVFPGRSQRF